MANEKGGNCHIGFCTNPNCRNLHIQFYDHPDHGTFDLMLPPGDAVIFATEIIEVVKAHSNVH